MKHHHLWELPVAGLSKAEPGLALPPERRQKPVHVRFLRLERADEAGGDGSVRSGAHVVKFRPGGERAFVGGLGQAALLLAVGLVCVSTIIVFSLLAGTLLRRAPAKPGS